MDEGGELAWASAAATSLDAGPPARAAAGEGKASLVQTRHLLSDCTGAGAECLLSTSAAVVPAYDSDDGAGASGASRSAAAEFFQLRPLPAVLDAEQPPGSWHEVEASGDSGLSLAATAHTAAVAAAAAAGAADEDARPASSASLTLSSPESLLLPYPPGEAAAAAAEAADAAANSGAGGI